MHISYSAQQWLTWLEQQHPIENIELGLDRISRVAKTLLEGDKIAPHIITVAGTNGKGSTVAYLGSILAEANVSYASFTSPHFVRYNERICLNGVPVSDADLVASFERVDAARHQTSPIPITLTYFEFNALAAFDLIRHWCPQVALLEVGLGGRLDATNVIDADIAIVTSIALDHEDWLGSNLAQIGLEKAGVFRKAHPAIYGQADGPKTVGEYAHQIGAPLFQKGQHFHEQAGQWTGHNYEGNEVTQPVPQVTLPCQNVAAAIQAIQLLPLDITDENVYRGLEKARLTGRMQYIAWRDRTLILDVAHNPQAASHIANVLRNSDESPGGDLHCVLGVLMDKDYMGVAAALTPIVDHWHFASTHGPRGLSGSELQVAIPTTSAATNVYGQVTDALLGAVTSSAKGDRLLVCGSFHTVGDVLAMLENDRLTTSLGTR